jgi:hypothetical protein
MRDGIIGTVSQLITGDSNGVYAIILNEGEECQIREHVLTSYTTWAQSGCVFKLSKPGTMGEGSHVVRVLRSAKLKSPLAPVAGIRYDGL